MNATGVLEAKGIVQRHPVPELLVEISQLGLDGSLRLTERDRKAVVYFDGGDISFAVSNVKAHRLFSILIEGKKIEEQDLAGVEDYVNDHRLANALVTKGIISEEEKERGFRSQILLILRDVICWQGGSWTFSPLARLKAGLSYKTDLRAALYESSRDMTDFEILSRFKSYEELFSLSVEAHELNLPLTSEEAFVLTRIGDSQTIEQIKENCGLEPNDLLPILYRLWLGGFVIRDNWNKAFNKETVDRFNSAKLTLSVSAKSVEEEERRKAAEAKRAAEEEARKEKERKDRERRAEERRARERKERAAGYEEVDLSVEKYLDLVETAPTFYAMFGLPPNSKPAAIKSAYFSYARRFHPDIFHRQVDEELHGRIQSAFTDIAHAYETLRNEESRELYDMKVEKIIANFSDADHDDLSSMTRDQVRKQDQSSAARESFDRGRELLEEGSHEEAARYLGRAVHLENDNAEYHAVYGLALAQERKNRHKAETEIQAAVKLAPADSRYRLMLVELYVEIGLSVRARNELNRLLEIDPGNARARELLKSI